jgi:hypothetical protein
MAEPGAPRAPRWARSIPVVVLVIAIGSVLVARAAGDEGAADASRAPDTAAPPADAVEIEASGPRFGDLDELIAASDLIVRGRTVATERGRWFGDGVEGPRLQSRLVTIEVDQVLAGTAEAGERILVEEEGWLEDGAAVIVAGAAPSQAGDRAIWFLADAGDPTTDVWIVVNEQGRYLEVDGALAGADTEDPLIAALEARTPDALADAIAAR